MPKTAFLEGRPTGVIGAISMPARLVRRLATGGVLTTAQRAVSKINVAWREWRYGLKTEQFIPWNELSSDACSVDYEPTTYSAIEHAFSYVDAPQDEVLLDYGCGMGRVLAMSLRSGFSEAIGVELSPDLCRAAEDNLERSVGSQSNRVQVICENAAEWSTPDAATVVYMFNPFRGRVLEETLDRIRESLVRRPRSLKLLYFQPLVDENVLTRRPWLQLDHEEVVEGIRFCVYSHRP